MSEFEQLRNVVANSYKIGEDRISRNKDYTHIVYRGDQAVAKTKSLEDAVTCREALIEKEWNSRDPQENCS